MACVSTAKSVIVADASRGIGRAVATRLAHDGFAVVVNFAGNSTKAEEVVAEIKAAGGQAIAVQADVASAADVERLFKEAVGTFGGINVVVNWAGIMHYSPIDRFDLDLFDKVITTNLRGTFIVLGQASRELSPGGRIITFSSSVIGMAYPTYEGYYNIHPNASEKKNSDYVSGWNQGQWIRSLSNVGFDKDFYPWPNNTNDNYLDYYIGVYNGAVAADNDNNANCTDGTDNYWPSGLTQEYCIGHKAGYSVEDYLINDA